MEKLSKEQVEGISLKRYGRTEFLDEINELQQGEAIKIPKSEWTKKSSPYNYYSSSPNTRGKVTVKILKDSYLVIKK